ncbi:MAG: pyridoxal-dependent decarboxylase, partial [Holophagales bacterium]|nr:pyridoxal-dependent decarboxylase [Holophagales bacterium]
MVRALDRALHHAEAWLAGSDDRSVGATASLEDLRRRLGRPLPENGSAAESVIDDLVADTRGGHLGSAGGRFFAWVIGGALESALAADWLVSAWDQNAALFACGPGVSVIEEVAGQWLLELLDLPRQSSFAFTTGCQMAHFTALAAARRSISMRAGWDVESEGLAGAPRIRVLASRQRHGSVERAVGFLGLGRRSIVPLDTDFYGRVTCRGLESALDDAGGGSIVVLNAADLDIGACDPFRELVPIARDRGAWVHVDGAFGLLARASRSKRHLLDGVDLADSWATDAHKWLNVPFDCGVAIVRDREAHRSAMTMSASYLTARTDARDQIDWNPEWSR